MKTLKIFGIITWSIFLIWIMYSITSVGLDEVDNVRYFFIDVKLDKGAIFLASLSLIMILVNIIFIKPKQESPFKELKY